MVSSQSILPCDMWVEFLLSPCDIFYKEFRTYLLPTTGLNGTSIVEDDEASFDRA